MNFACAVSNVKAASTRRLFKRERTLSRPPQTFQSYAARRHLPARDNRPKPASRFIEADTACFIQPSRGSPARNQMLCPGRALNEARYHSMEPNHASPAIDIDYYGEAAPMQPSARASPEHI